MAWFLMGGCWGAEAERIATLEDQLQRQEEFVGKLQGELDRSKAMILSLSNAQPQQPATPLEKRTLPLFSARHDTRTTHARHDTTRHTAHFAFSAHWAQKRKTMARWRLR
jgi:hypothetical protein